MTHSEEVQKMLAMAQKQPKHLTHNDQAKDQGIAVSENLVLNMNAACTEMSINRTDNNSCFIDVEVVNGKLMITYHDLSQADVVVYQPSQEHLETMKEIEENEEFYRKHEEADRND